MEKTIGSRRAFDGRLLKVDVLDIELDGGKKAVREVLRHPGAVAVLARLPDGRFVFVRQYRSAIQKDLLEIMAGTLEPGERPDACALRELKEETGYAARRLVRLGGIYNAPGYSSEMLHIFFAELEPAPGQQACDEGEVIHVVILAAAEVEAMIGRGELTDAKSLAAWVMYEKREGHL